MLYHHLISNHNFIIIADLQIIPPSKKPALPVWATDSLQLFNSDVRQCFKDFFVLYSFDSIWQQAQFGLSFGCFDLCFLSHLHVQPILLLCAPSVWTQG